MAKSIHRAIGGAGTGKTTLILSKLDQAKKELSLSTDEIGLCTFTRAGRAEISERAAGLWGVSVDNLTKSGWFKTAHAIAHSCCEIKSGQLLGGGKEDDKWVSDAVGGQVVTSWDSRGSRTYVSSEDKTVPLSMKAWDLARNTMRPLAAVIEQWLAAGEPVPDIGEAKMIIQRYERAKFKDDRVDFTDMIAGFAGVKFTIDGPVEIPPTGEAPAGLRVLAIDEAQDSSALVDRVCRRLAASDTIERVFLMGDPYQCQPAGTPVQTTEGYKPIEFLEPGKDILVAYNIRSGKFHEAPYFATAWRDVDAGELVEITFADGSKHVCTRNHKWVVKERWGRAKKLPAEEIIPGVHRVPRVSGGWLEVSSIDARGGGGPVRVYSLEVRWHHTYVTTNGIVTGNSIYGFSGGDYRLFLNWDAQEEIMPRSYRCPSRIMDLGERCLRRMNYGYKRRGIEPAKDGGIIEVVNSVGEALLDIKADSSALILGRCAHNLQDYEEFLLRSGVPYQWVDKGHSAAQSAGFASLLAIEQGRVFLGEDFSNVVDMIVADGNLVRGAKTAWKDGRKSNLDIIRPVDQDLAEAGLTPKAIEMIRSGKSSELIDSRNRERAALWRKTAIECGVAVASNPPVRLSTIHAAKGMEASHVVLSAETSGAVERGREADENIHDEECRVEYVAVTRARDRFTFVDSLNGARGIDLPI